MFRSKALSRLAQWVPLLALFPFLMPQLEKSFIAPVIFFMAVIVADNGHIIITAFRIFSKNRTSREKYVFLGVTLGSIFLTGAWLTLQVPFYWSFFLYFTVFHHLKQNLGVFRWLAKSENSQIPHLNVYAYVCFALPFLFFHLRTDIETESVIYGLIQISEASKIALPHPQLIQNIGHLLAAGLLLTSFSMFLVGWRKQKQGRTGLYVIAVTALNVFSMIYGRNFFEIYIPLIISHGVTYFLVTSDALVKVQKYSVARSIGMIITVAITYGVLDWALQADNLFEYTTTKLSSWVILGAAITAGLNIAHYTIDGFIWKKGDADYKALHTS